MKKIILLVIDGLGDRPSTALNGKTPLEAASMPSVERLVPASLIGSIDNSLGLSEPTSDLAVLSLLGYDPKKIKAPRSILDVIAEGLPFNDGELALHCNFATLADDGVTLLDRRVGRTLTKGEAQILERFINENLEIKNASFVFKHTVDYMGVLVIKHSEGWLDAEISDVDPWRADQPKLLNECKPLNNSIEARRACEAVNEFVKETREKLREHPINRYRRELKMLEANVIVTRQAGNRMPKGHVKLSDKYDLRFAAQARLPTERGIARLVGMEVIDVPQIAPHENLGAYYAERARIIAQKIKEYDVIYSHFDEADDAAHDGDALRKKHVLETWDKYFLAELMSRIDLHDVVLCITADHATVCELKAHTADPTPLLIYGGAHKYKGYIARFSERECNRSPFKITGVQLLDSLIEMSMS